ncbi:transglycosylase SLT domain-containing protein [Methylophilaceae bacterium]|nr:transglycosylase SLT domain-containing protein [Methylophilaceae bacterium]
MNLNKLEVEKMHFRHITRLFFFLLILLISNSSWSLTNVMGDKITIIDYTSLQAELIDSQAVISNSNLSSQPKSIWPRLKNGFSFKSKPSKRAKKIIKKYETWYKNRPEYIERMLNRSEKYLFHVVEQVQLRGMPTEIALLPMIESAYNPLARSRMKAMGMWQFIPSTGKVYGLKQNWWRDDRRNVINSTTAALDYLEKLYAMFGTWELALAAYNAGEGRVGRAIKRNKKLKKPTDYYNIRLPRETRNYVPKLLAIKNIISNPRKYDLYISDIADKPYFESIILPKEIDTDLIAEFAEIPMEEFQLLNAQHKRPLMRSEHYSQEVLLPINSIQTFHNNMAIYDKPLVSWKTYSPKPGEKVYQVARKFGINTKLLAQVNQISSRKKFRRNSIVLIPYGEASKTKFPLNSDSLFNYSTIVTHQISPGETLSHIADDYKMSVRDLMEFNELKSTKIISGSTLDIPK